MIILEEFEEDTGNLETRTEQERSIEMDMSDSLHERMDMDEERDDSIEGNIGEEIGIQESTGRETNMYNTDNDGLNTDIGDNDIERRPIDIKEDRRVSGFFETGCGCSQECWKKFDAGYLKHTRSNLLELSLSELEMVVMGQIMATTFFQGSTSNNRKIERKRLRTFTTFYHGGVKVHVCVNTCKLTCTFDPIIDL